MSICPVTSRAAGIDGTGSIATCPATGNVKLKPALLTGGTEAGAVKLTVKTSGACTGGTGDGSSIVSYKVKGAGTTSANSCTSFVGTESSDLALTFKWKVAKDSPKLNPSTATFAMQPGSLALNGDQTVDLSGVITAGSFVGTHVTAHFESDDTAATLLTACGDKGLKKIPFGMKGDATSSCVNGPNMAAAITQQITSIDSNDVPHLELEITTVTASPFQLTESDLTTSTTGVHLESVSSTCELSTGQYRCRHTAHYVSTGACQWDGDYTMNLSYSCNPTNTCDLCSGSATVPFTLDSENFCSVGTAFCSLDLSCSAATAGASTGGVPCCSDTYTPLISCLDQYCPTECATAINGDGGIVPSSPCYDCAFSSCHDPFFACSSDMQVCPAD
jgi:hypothetical protein